MYRPRHTKEPLEQQPKPLSKKKRVIITPFIRPVPSVRIIKPSTALSTPQPVSIPEPPEQTTFQILLPDPPVVETTSQILYQIHLWSRQPPSDPSTRSTI
ncbi:hypothetical protein TNCV_4524191 [Trichonephila clavipes]|nr:hypothetical protein TNCV_4524191 [Trichonephila clavipes]